MINDLATSESNRHRHVCADQPFSHLLTRSTEELEKAAQGGVKSARAGHSSVPTVHNVSPFAKMASSIKKDRQ